MGEPDEYFKSTTLNLYFKDTKDCSLDEVGAQKYKKDKSKANTHGSYVQQVQKDLISLGYLSAKTDKNEANDDGYYGRGSARSISRFQRHAKRLYRMDSAKTSKDVKQAEVFSGNVTGICDTETAKEIRKWIDKGFVLPLGRIKIKALTNGGKLREDAAEEWEKIVKAVTDKGGILEGPYGDSLRPFNKTSKVGTSSFSFHYCGRAVDIKQELANPKGRRYFVMKDASGTNTFWRIYCKTEKQDGTQGLEMKKGDKKCWDFGDEKEYSIPAGWYFDMTAEVESHNFERIKAQSGWDDTTKKKGDRYNKTEWWHFQFKLDKQSTFQDELELIGIAEKEMNDKGWNTDALKDHAPG